MKPAKTERTGNFEWFFIRAISLREFNGPVFLCNWDRAIIIPFFLPSISWEGLMSFKSEDWGERIISRRFSPSFENLIFPPSSLDANWLRTGRRVKIELHPKAKKGGENSCLFPPLFFVGSWPLLALEIGEPPKKKSYFNSSERRTEDFFNNWKQFNKEFFFLFLPLCQGTKARMNGGFLSLSSGVRVKEKKKITS